MNYKFVAGTALASLLTFQSKNYSTQLGRGSKDASRGKVKQTIEAEYSDYIEMYGKTFETDDEYKMRLKYFEDSYWQVLKMNQEQTNGGDPDAVLLGLNFFSDWSDDEYEEYLGSLAKFVNLPAG